MRTAFGGGFAGVRVLVTGHTGFKGSWLSIWLRELGAEVTGYSLDPPTVPSNFQLCRLDQKIHDVRGDVRHLDQLEQAIRKYEPELVLHLAAQPLVTAGYREPKATFDVNAGGVVNLLEAARHTTSVKAIVLVTSDKVYEDQERPNGYREDDLLGGYDPYSASKAMAELAIQAYRRSWSQQWTDGSARQRFSAHGVAIASVRAGNVVGGGDFAKDRLVPDCMAALHTGTPLVLRNPKSVRHWQYILEPLSGYLWLALNLLAEQGKVASRGEVSPADRFGEAWNFGPQAHESVTCEAVVQKSMQLWGTVVPVTSPEAGGAHETSVLRVNWDKAARRLAWHPVYTWERALEETVNWWKEYTQHVSSAAIDMYDFSVQQITRYLTDARALGVRWATARVLPASEPPRGAGTW